jgi:protein-disulfide isomerase
MAPISFRFIPKWTDIHNDVNRPSVAPPHMSRGRGTTYLRATPNAQPAPPPHQKVDRPDGDWHLLSDSAFAAALAALEKLSSKEKRMTRLKPPVSLDDHVAGPAGAAVTLVEYGDYQCSHCTAAHPIVQQLQERFGDRLRFVFRNFPHKQAHPHAQAAAETAEFAAAHGKFWEMHDLLFENQQRLGGMLFLELARSLDLAPAALSQALEDGQFTPRVHADFSGGLRSGVNRTPAFFVNGQRQLGSFDFAGLSLAVEHALEMAERPRPEQHLLARTPPAKPRKSA